MEMKVMNGYQDVRLRGDISGTQQDINSSTQFMYDSTNSGFQKSSTDLRYGDMGHREMAIDCPTNFVGVKKQQPRLRRPLSSVSQGTPSGSPKGSLQSTNSKSRPVVVQQPSGAKSRGSIAENTGSLSRTDAVFERDERDQSERIRRYQEDLARKKEFEERANQQNVLLRASLRGSQKMQGLEERKERLRALEAHEGIDNPNYSSTGEDGIKRQLLSFGQATVPSMTQHRFGTSIDSQAVGQTNVEDILTSLQQAKNYLSDSDDQRDLNRVAQFVASEKFQRLLRLHNHLVERALVEPALDARVPTRVTDVSQSIIDNLSAHGSNNRYARELFTVLNGTHFRNLLYAYENSAQNKLTPVKSVTDEDEREYLYERASQYGDENIKIVRIQKSSDPLGATVRREGDSIIIGRIVKGGAAEKSGLLHEGDEILEINGIDIRGRSIDDVCDIMSPLAGVVTFLINPGLDHSPALRRQHDLVMHVRALFSYDPEEDPFIPCRELGISFKKGDILHVLNQDDPNCWQAYRNGEEDQNLAGLIPSKSFQEQKEALRMMVLGDEKEHQKKNGCHCTRRPKRKKKNQFDNVASDDSVAEEILTYEQVVLYYPQPNRKRPIVLLGPPNVGRQELRERLLKSDFDRFAAAIPHTTRPLKDDEVNGREYHVVSKAAFMDDIANDRFLEYGEHEKHLFGTSKNAVRQVVNAGKICVLNLHPQSIRVLRASDLKPYFIYISPPNIQKLRQLCQKLGTKSALERDEDLENIIATGRRMEDTYGSFFDMVIVNQDMDKAYDELLAEINRLEIEPQWVPIQWVT